jgi:circadian clock protein KaiC
LRAERWPSTQIEANHYLAVVVRSKEDERMADSQEGAPAIEQVPSGIAGLDIVLRGGFLKGGSYIVIGPPGSGKTILANQISYSRIAAGDRVVYITMLAETHSRMLAHLQSLSFFNREPIGKALFYFSGYHALETDGLSGLLGMLRGAIRDHNATILMVDGLGSVEAFADSPTAFKRFIYELRAYVDVVGCTMFLTTTRDVGREHPEQTVVDGIIELSDDHVGLRSVREIEVRKLRGSSYLRGRHIFRITDAGLIIHPRTESMLAEPSAAPTERRVRCHTGVAQLDAMLGGGLFSGSTTLALGAPGTGKTLLGLHFLAAGLRENERALHFGFYEPPERLIAKGDQIGLELGAAVQRGSLTIHWQIPLQVNLDMIAEQLLESVRAQQINRLFIDGLNGFRLAAAYPSRMPHFFTALINELRARDVTTVVAAETTTLLGDEIEMPAAGLSAIVENIILLRHVELRSQLYRLISILKVREGAYDSAIREFKISAQGIEVADTFESAEAMLTGAVRTSTPPSRRGAGKPSSRGRRRS